MNPASAAAAQQTSAQLAAAPACPACAAAVLGTPLEIFHGASLFSCPACDLHFWHPVRMPDAAWHESIYQGRDQTEMPLEPGHKFFFADPRAPKSGRLLDLGCGVGNFLAAARRSGFDPTGVELNQNAARFALDHYGLERVFAMRPEEFLAAHPAEKFDVVTFFEVLEHQDAPQHFLSTVRKFLAPGGFIALSVPNRNRWQKGIETLDYPPNHLTRWSPRALENFLSRNGFEILSLREEPLHLLRAAEVLSASLRTGLATRVAGEAPPTPTDLSTMAAAESQAALRRVAENPGHRLAARLAALKIYALLPAAALLLPFLRLRHLPGLYLYSLCRAKS